MGASVCALPDGVSRRPEQSMLHFGVGMAGYKGKRKNYRTISNWFPPKFPSGTLEPASQFSGGDLGMSRKRIGIAKLLALTLEPTKGVGGIKDERAVVMEKSS
ncbi:hypothetical protein H6P81_021719 [Aristolochia fimbriata]|uniref:Uncharacterized protein n=1 Tax=Aristolochia fimbriata TaxID=158543 RepID=A0AAV7DS80_ARIFI|nr:hypothetical protein H6P81_021719 [Aristolochia fimbriata]